MYSPPVRLPPVRRREELRPACRGGRPHRTSIRKTDRYGPAVHPAQALPAARCRPPIFHVPALPQLLQCPVRQDTLVPEISICQSPHGPVCPVMGTYIGVAGRPTVAEIEKFSLGAAVQTINHAGRAERGIGMAIRTFDLFLLHHKIITSKRRAKGGAMASFCAKISCSGCSWGPGKAA